MSFYSKYVRHNIGLKLLALAAAVLLWAAVAREPIAEVAVNVPIEFQNIADPLEISSETLPEAQVRVRGTERLLTFVRSMYEMVYMISATGMMRSQRCSFIVGAAFH